MAAGSGHAGRCRVGAALLGLIGGAAPAVAAPTAPTVLAGGQVLAKPVAAPPGGAVPWALTFDRAVLAAGQAIAGPRGRALIRVEMPAVRTRIACRLTWNPPGARRELSLAVYPARVYGPYARRLAALDIVVPTPGGGAAAALAAEGIPRRVLATQIQRDFTDGDVIILASRRNPDALRAACEVFSRRVADGTHILVLDPPPGWSLWGLRSVPARGRGRLHRQEAMPSLARAEDFGRGPWPVALTGGPAMQRLVVAVGGAGDAVPRRVVLAAAVRRGKGLLAASALPCTGRADRNILGRAALGELLLWLAARAPQTARKQRSDDAHKPSANERAAAGGLCLPAGCGRADDAPGR